MQEQERSAKTAAITTGLEEELQKIGHADETPEERALRLASLVVLVQQMDDTSPCGGVKYTLALRCASVFILVFLHKPDLLCKCYQECPRFMALYPCRWFSEAGPHPSWARHTAICRPPCPGGSR